MRGCVCLEKIVCSVKEDLSFLLTRNFEEVAMEHDTCTGMLWTALLTVLGLVTTAVSINRPVYKILLTQKGYTQFSSYIHNEVIGGRKLPEMIREKDGTAMPLFFLLDLGGTAVPPDYYRAFLQYELDTPAVREFTVCVWIRFYEFVNEQSVFTYVVDHNNRLVRLWVDSNGSRLTVSFAEQSTSVPVELDENLWRHVCLSYQSDYGAWALYIDSRLAICRVEQGFQQYVFPGGSVIFGYGAGQSGIPNGVEGEIFGANMILLSTIERNTALNINSRKRFQGKSNVKWPNGDKYVVLSDLQTEEINTAIDETLPRTATKVNNIKRTQKNSSAIEHPFLPKKEDLVNLMNDMEIFRLLMDYNPENKRTVTTKPTEGFENIHSAPSSVMVSEFDIPERNSAPVAHTLTPEFEYTTPTITAPTTMLSVFETPPPFTASNDYVQYLEPRLKSSSLPPLSNSAYKKLRDEFNVKLDKTNQITQKKYADDLSDIDVPPSSKKDTKVYGQWTSSKYAGIVLDHIKRNNIHSNRHKIPATIPLVKLSDRYPYPSTLKQNSERHSPHYRATNPKLHKNINNDHSQIHSHSKVHHRYKRAKTLPDINVKIIEHDIRSEIMNDHAKTKPRKVRIINRSQPYEKRNKTKGTDQYYNKHKEFLQDIMIEDTLTDTNGASDNSLIDIMPFLKSIEFYTTDYYHINGNPDKTTTENDIYAKTSKNNEWDDAGDSRVDISQKAIVQNKKHPIRLKYKSDTDRIVSTKDEASILEGISLARDVSNQSNPDHKHISIIKYNHGYLPGHTDKQHLGDKSFHKKVKIGNALNENKFLRHSENKRHYSNVDNENVYGIRIPEIHNKQYYVNVVPLKCKNIEILDQILYAHEDGSVDLTHIISPVKVKNVAVEFVLQNYKKCSMEDSPLENNILLVINWNKTPVRLFGGATPKKTKDLCGFF